MNKKKGFTLIELLAIIVILAVIAVITVPLILNIINDAQKNASIDSAYGYKDALEKYYITKTVKNTEYELPNGYKEISELPGDFIVSGESPSEGWVKLKKGLVDKFSLKYNEYVVTMDNDKNVTSEKLDNAYSHVTDDYQEIEYLESTGTQYIDTGYFPSSNTKVEIKFMGLDNNPTGALPLFGSRTSVETKSFTVFYRTSSIGRIDYGNYSESNPTINFNNNTIHAFVKDKEKNYLDGVYVNSNDSSDFSSDYTMYLNNVNTSGSSFSKLFSSRLYYTKIYDNGSLARNLVPVIRKSDNKPGMLDLSATNLFDKDAEGIINYKYITPSGSLSDSSNHFVSDYIDIRGKKNITISNVTPQTIVYCSFYDSSKELISSFRYNIIPKIQEVPNDANYVRCTVAKTMSSNFMLNEGTTDLPYEPYKKSFYTNAGTDEFITGPEI